MKSLNNGICKEMSQDTSVSSLIINKLTKQQYEDIVNPSPTELYIVSGETDNADVDLSNLSSVGAEKLHALKGYEDDGTTLTDATGLADVIKYTHSTFDVSKFTVTGTPMIVDGVVSNFTSTNGIEVPSVTLNATAFSGKDWKKGKSGVYYREERMSFRQCVLRCA